MKRLSLLVFLLSLPALFILSAPVQAAFDPFGEACENVAEGTERPAACDTPADDPLTGASGNEGIILRATNLVAMITGVAAVIIIILAGLQYITAAGEANKVGGAKQTIIFAAVGLVIVMVARLIVIFVIRRF